MRGGLGARDQIRDWHIHAVLVSGMLIVSLANYYAGPSTLYPLLYMWAALYAFYFFPMREALAHMALIGVSYAVVLAIQNARQPVVRWLLAVGTPLVAGLSSRASCAGSGATAPGAAAARRSARGSCSTRHQTRSSRSTATASSPTWNAAAERLFGWTAAEAIGKTMRELIVPPEYGERPRRAPPGAGRQHRRRSRPRPTRWSCVRRDGTPLPG